MGQIITSYMAAKLKAGVVACTLNVTNFTLYNFAPTESTL